MEERRCRSRRWRRLRRGGEGVEDGGVGDGWWEVEQWRWMT